MNDKKQRVGIAYRDVFDIPGLYEKHTSPRSKGTIIESCKLGGRYRDTGKVVNGVSIEGNSLEQYLKNYKGSSIKGGIKFSETNKLGINLENELGINLEKEHGDGSFNMGIGYQLKEPENRVTLMNPNRDSVETYQLKEPENSSAGYKRKEPRKKIRK